MPTVLRVGAFEFSINAREKPFEPPHVHVWFADADADARINLITQAWLDPLPPKAAEAQKIFARNRQQFVDAWNLFHSDREVT